MNQSYSYSCSKDQLLGFDDVDRSYRVDHMTDEICPVCGEKLKLKRKGVDILCASCLAFVIPKEIAQEIIADQDEDKNLISDNFDPSYDDYDPHTEEAKGNLEERQRIADAKHTDGYGSGTSVGHPEIGLTSEIKDKKFWKEIKKWDERIPVSKKDRNWKFWRRTVLRMTENLLPGPGNKTIRQYVYDLFQKCLSKKLLRGRKFVLILANCIRIEMKRAGIRMDYHEIDEELGWKEKMAQYNHLIQTECILDENPSTNLPHSSPEEYVEEITNAVCTAMKIDNHEDISSTASKILKNAKVFGKNPKNLAAAAVYLSCRKHECEIDIYKMGDIVKISTATIKTITKELEIKLIDH